MPSEHERHKRLLDPAWLLLWTQAFSNLCTRGRIGEPTQELYDKYALEAEAIADAGSVRCGKIVGDQW